MRTLRISATLIAGLVIIGTGCHRSERQKTERHDRQKQAAKTAARPAALTAENNPTAVAGRGQPSLEDGYRPAAWIYINDQGGTFLEREGNPQVQWIIEKPVGPSPTFRVEGYEPLLGRPKDFNCLIDTLEAKDGSKVAYAVAANPGTFEVGRAYSLLQPGNNFVIRNRATGDVLTEIASLGPGTYLIVAGVKNLEMGREALAVTSFTVAENSTK